MIDMQTCVPRKDHDAIPCQGDAMKAARRFFLKQLVFTGLFTVGGFSLFAKSLKIVPEESPYLEIDEMYEEGDELYGLDGWL